MLNINNDSQKYHLRSWFDQIQSYGQDTDKWTTDMLLGMEQERKK